jgi:hypothetical protein
MRELERWVARLPANSIRKPGLPLCQLFTRNAFVAKGVVLQINGKHQSSAEAIGACAP